MERPTVNLRRYVSLRQLEVFEAIARLGSFRRAAQTLHVTQPTVSVQIRKLSEAVGLPLFEQVGKRVYLTDAGRSLYESCREMFDTLERFEMDVANMKGLTRGRLRLAVVTTAKYFAPRLLGGFCERYTGVDVALKVTNRERVLERLQANEDDLYIFGQPPAGVDVEAVPFLRNPLVALAPPGHPLADRGSVPLEEFGEYPFLAREPGSGTRLAVERLCDEYGVTLKVRMELGSNEAIKQSVAAGMGVSVLSEHTLSRGGEEVAVLDVEGFPIERHWYLVYPVGKQLSVAARTFMDYLLAEGGRVAETGVSAIPRSPQGGWPVGTAEDREPVAGANPTVRPERRR
ncbi:MAG: LysR substrate-binding domain-containing protein [Thiohalorhabdus sp.]|uniref:LysR family transcriptional regulator n=1 Tax=Thiohalorhabdus sp. TaxID=3094134 RepID=UPI00397F9DC8